MRALGPLTAAASVALVRAAAADPHVPPPDASSTAPVRCAEDAYCPPASTCCHASSASSSSSSSSPGSSGFSCLVSWSSRAPRGPCCADASGCAARYACAAPAADAAGDAGDGGTLVRGPHCRRDDDAAPVVDARGRPVDADYELTPRYRTCPAFALEDLASPHGLPVPVPTGPASGGEAPTVGQLAYFTNKGPLASSSHRRVKTAVVGVHGSGRDAGSYLCALVAALLPDSPEGGFPSPEAVEMQRADVRGGGSRVQRRQREAGGAEEGGEAPDDTLVVAPWFLAPADGAPASSSALPFLQWVDEAAVSHSFRYGAESLPVDAPGGEGGAAAGDERATTVSSFGAMDALLETLCDRDRYPRLERIVLVGHSAGGQFVQRYGLSSDSWCFGDTDGDEGGGELPLVRIVVANPRSYTYLDRRRYLPAEGNAATVSDKPSHGLAEAFVETTDQDLDFRAPNAAELESCPAYNEYCWGLDANPDLPAPYVADRLARLLLDDHAAGGAAEGDDAAAAAAAATATAAFARYAARDVVYLAGERDVTPLGEQLCAEDGHQGPTRRERSARFHAALQVRGAEVARTCPRGGADGERFCARWEAPGDARGRVHARRVVGDVGHDHALIFQSAQGREAMFG